VIGRWRKAVNAPVLAFARLEAAWPKPPPDPEPVTRLEREWFNDPARLKRSPHDAREPPTLLGALVEGVRFANRLKDKLSAERDMLATTVGAAAAVKTLRAFVATITREAREPLTDTPLDNFAVINADEIETAKLGLEALFGLVDLRARRARRHRALFEVGREAQSKANVKSPLAGPTREGMKRTARRLREGAPSVGLDDIALVLKVTFGVGSTLVKAKMVENWTAGQQ
jgi:hypothetical protein